MARALSVYSSACLGDENDVAVCLADAATSIVADETEASDAGGADVAVQTGSVGNPFQRPRTHSATVIHLSILKPRTLARSKFTIQGLGKSVWSVISDY